MLKKIPISQLRIGMHTVDAGLTDLDSPHIFSAELDIKTQEQIASIVDGGFTEIFIDTDKSVYYKDNVDARQNVTRYYQKLLTDKVSKRDQRRSVSEMCKHFAPAEKFYSEAVARARDLSDYIEKNRTVPLDDARLIVDGILGSVTENLDALSFIAKIREYDSYTYTHGLNVTILAIAFGMYLGLGEKNITALGYSGLFHDLGKIFVPPEVLNKPGKLTEPEFELIKQHPALGHEVLTQCQGVPRDVQRACLEHHEKYAGGGYPNNYSYAQISNTAALISIVDVFDALTSNRCYKPAMHSHKALCIIFNLKNSAFLPILAEKFVKFLGVYPLGAIVILRDGRKGIVIEQNEDCMLRPKVRIVLDQQNRHCKIADIDLSLDLYSKNTDYDIVECLGAEECRIDVASYFEQK